MIVDSECDATDKTDTSECESPSDHSEHSEHSKHSDSAAAPVLTFDNLLKYSYLPRVKNDTMLSTIISLLSNYEIEKKDEFTDLL